MDMTLAIAAKVAADNRLMIAALIRALKQTQPESYAVYVSTMEHLLEAQRADEDPLRDYLSENGVPIPPILF